MIDDLWYKNAIIYSLNVGTYMDSNGEGIGDFEGLSRCLDYLSGLGITCIWIQPFQPSPYKDDGYDITDYYGVDPRHGSSGDFVDFPIQWTAPADDDATCVRVGFIQLSCTSASWGT